MEGLGASSTLAGIKRSKYRLLGLVGQGQFGRVFCAAHRKTGQLVALKELNRYRFPTNKFLRELRFLLSLQHPNIVTCKSLEHFSTGRYLVMDYCEGGTLRGLMNEELSLEPAQGLKLVADVLRGLTHAHNRGIVHCDIKPENILLTVTADGWNARISDFGIARVSQEFLPEGTGNTGSPAYMAPERFYGQYSPASDLYAVGIMLFELLVGDRPFTGVPTDLMAAHLNQQVVIPETIPPSIAAIIRTSLQKLPGRRFRSAAEMLKILETAMELEGYTAALTSEHRSTALLKSRVSVRTTPFISLYAEALDNPLAAVAIAYHLNQVPRHRDLYKAVDHEVQIHTLASGQRLVEELARNHQSASPSPVTADANAVNLLHSMDAPNQIDLGLATQEKFTTVSFGEPVRDLWIRPQGCFIVTTRSIYLLPFQTVDADGSGAMTGLLSPFQLQRFSTDFVATVAADGQWLAIATDNPEDANSVLTLWKVPTMREIGKPMPCRSPYLSQIVTLDAHHGVVISDLLERSRDNDLDLLNPRIASRDSKTRSYSSRGTLMEVFTRRGHLLASLTLPIPIRQAIPTPTPFRLLAVEQLYPESLVMIDLKPFRLSRFGVGLVPALLAATTWGYLVMDAKGKIVLFNQEMQKIGQINGPANPTAMVTFNNYNLLVSTWDGQRGNLYTIDLRELDLDFIF